MNKVTHILGRIEQGELQAAEQLLPLVYDELRTLAAQLSPRRSPARRSEATALVPRGRTPAARGYPKRPGVGTARGHFFAAAAEAMRAHPHPSGPGARAAAEAGRGSGNCVDLDNLDLFTSVTPDQLLALDEAIDRLAREDPTAASLVKLRYYAGLSLEEAAEPLTPISAGDRLPALVVRPRLATLCIA